MPNEADMLKAASGQSIDRERIGVLVQGKFWHFKGTVDEHSAVLRRAKKRAHTITAAIGVINIVLGALCIGFSIWQISDTLDTVVAIVEQPLFQIGWLWILVAMCFLYYRYAVTQSNAHVLPKIEKEQLSGVTTLPDLSVVERRVAMNAYFTEEAMDVIDEMMRLVRVGGQASVDPAHLFLATVGSHEIRMVFLRLNLTFDQMKDALRRHMASLPKGTAVFDAGTAELLGESLYAALRSRSHHIAVVDLFWAAYVKSDFLQELFYSLHVEQEEVMQVMEWMRINTKLIQRVEEYRRLAALKPTGNMNRAYTAVQTQILDAVSEDMTSAGVKGYLPLLIGREKELSQVFRSIEGSGRSVVLVGSPGVGRKTIIAGIAERMIEEDVPKRLADKRLVRLSLPHILTGAGSLQPQELFLRVLQEVGASGNIILVIDGLEQIVQQGGGTLASLLASELEKRYTFVIATTTPAGFSAIEKSVLASQFEKVIINEANASEAITVLESKVGALESKHRIIFTYEALAALVELSMRYMHESYLPNKAIILAQELALKHAQGNKDAWPRVTKQDAEQFIAEKTSIPVTEVSQQESGELLDLEDRIHARVIGQDHAVAAVANALRRARVNLRDEGRPIATFLFLGPTGVGKTELAKATAEVYFGNETAMLRFDMSEYQDQASIVRLIGNAGTSGLLTEGVRKQPYTLLLLDELEKAHPDILNIFLQVMEDGRLTDGTGQTIDFTNVILIATSNAGSGFIEDQVRAGANIETIHTGLMEGELRQHYRPEFLNRFDGVMVFKPLDEEDVVAIAYLMIAKIVERIQTKGIMLRVTDAMVHELAKQGFDPAYGARPLRRVLQDRVENTIAEYLLKGKVGRRDALVLDAGGVIRVEKATTL